MPTNGSTEQCFCGCENCEHTPTAIAVITALSDEYSTKCDVFICTACLLSVASDPLGAVPPEIMDKLSGDLVVRLEARGIPGKPHFKDDPRVVEWADQNAGVGRALMKHANN